MISAKAPEDGDITPSMGNARFSAGVVLGVACLAASVSVGNVNAAGIGAMARNVELGESLIEGRRRQPRNFVGMLLLLIFAESFALNGLIFSLVMISSSKKAYAGEQDVGGPAPLHRMPGYMGMIIASCGASVGSAYASSKLGVATMAISAERPDLLMKAMVLTVMASVIDTLGLVVGVVMNGKILLAQSPEAMETLQKAGQIFGCAALVSGVMLAHFCAPDLVVLKENPQHYSKMLSKAIPFQSVALVGLFSAFVMVAKVH